MDFDLQACIRGDARAWAKFVELYGGVIHAAVRRTLGSRASGGEVDDAVQDVFVRLVNHDFRLLASYDPRRAALTTWLTLVSRSTAIDRLRRRRSEPIPIENIEIAAGEASTDAAGPRIPLHLLSDRQRLVLSLLFDDGCSVPEAALILDVDEQTIRSTKHKALSRLRQHFSDEDSGPA